MYRGKNKEDIRKLKLFFIMIEPRREMSNNVVCATSEVSDQPETQRAEVEKMKISANHEILLPTFSLRSN